MPSKPSPRVSGALLVAGIDITRHLVRAWTARREEQEHADRFHLGLTERSSAIRDRSRGAVRSAASHAPAGLQRRLPDWAAPAPWHVEHRPVLVASAFLGVLVGAAIAVATASRRITGAPPVTQRARAAALDVHERATSNASAVETAIDAGGAATIAAIDAVASDASAAATAAKVAATDEVHHRVVEPIKAKATRIGALALAGLTAYIIVVSALVQVLVAQFT